MRAPISVVIPTLNAAAGMSGCVAGLFEGLEAGLIRDLIVSDGGSGDHIADSAESLGAYLVTGAAGRGGQLARGAQAAAGDWLLFLHADTVLAPGWSGAVRRHMAATPDCAGYFRLAFGQHGFAPRFVAGWANLRSRLLGLPYGDQGLLISRTVYDAAGGFQDIALMEDVAMARALHGRLRPMEAVATTSWVRYQQQGWIRRGWRNIWTLMRYFAGVAPERLARAYRS